MTNHFNTTACCLFNTIDCFFISNRLNCITIIKKTFILINFLDSRCWRCLWIIWFWVRSRTLWSMRYRLTKTKVLLMTNKLISIDYLTGIVDRAKIICNVARETNLENIITFKIWFLILIINLRIQCRYLPFSCLFVIKYSNENISTVHQWHLHNTKNEVTTFFIRTLAFPNQCAKTNNLDDYSNRLVM